MKMSKSIKYWVTGTALLLVVGLAYAYSQTTLYVIPPIGAVPDGATFLVDRGEGKRFVESADSLCLKKIGYVNLLCRGMELKELQQHRSIHVRLEYNDALYNYTIDRDQR